MLKETQNVPLIMICQLGARQLAIEDDMLHLKGQQSDPWIAHLEELGNDEEQFCRNSYISLEMLNRITVMDGGAPELLEKLFGLLQVRDVTPLCLSQQYETQEHLPDKVFYVLGGWRCRYFFRVEATIIDLQEDLLSVEVRICPASLLNHVSQVRAPLIFTSTCPTTEEWLPRLHAIAVNATERFRELLGYFTLDQMNSIEDIIENIK